MKILSLEIANFMAISVASIKLADRGLVLVQGVNKDDTSADSNGAGKSSIADALCWVLYGETARGESGDAIVNQAAGKGCMVGVTLQEGDQSYTIRRYRKHKTGKNSVTISMAEVSPLHIITADFTKGTDKLTQVEIEKIVGCSYDVFRASIYSGQEAMPDLPGMTDRNLKTIVEEAAGVTVLERAYEEARTRFNASKSKQQNAQVKAESSIERVKDQEEIIEATKERIKAWNRDQDDKIASLMSDAITLNDRAKLAADEVLKLRQPALIEADILAVRKQLDGLANEQKTERELGQKLSAAERVDAGLRANLSSIKLAFEKARDGIAEVDHKVGCPCDDCGRPLTAAEIAPAKASITARARALKADFEATRTRAQSAIDARRALQSELDDYRAHMTDTSAASATLARLEAEKAEQARAAEAFRRSEQVTLDAVARATAAQKEENPFVMMAASQAAEILGRQISLADANARLDEANYELAVATEVSKVFSPAGVRGMILEEVTPFLNDQIAIYLGILSDGNIRATWSTLTLNAKGEAKEKFAIEVENALGGGSFGLLSGGEKRKVRIAAALALQDLVASRATKKIELWIGDEVDNALDPAGIERLMMILQEKAKERGSVFVISHTNLKDWISQVLTVVKEAGVSTIEESVA